MSPTRDAPRSEHVGPPSRLGHDSLRRGRQLGLILASLLGTAFLAAAVSAPPASAYAAGAWQGTIGLEWDAQNRFINEDGSAGALSDHEQLDAQITITGSGDPTVRPTPELPVTRSSTVRSARPGPTISLAMSWRPSHTTSRAQRPGPS